MSKVIKAIAITFVVVFAIATLFPAAFFVPLVGQTMFGIFAGALASALGAAFYVG